MVRKDKKMNESQFEMNKRGNTEINFRVSQTEKSYQQWKQDWTQYSRKQPASLKNTNLVLVVVFSRVLVGILADIRKLFAKQAELAPRV